jgi:catechol 2,3-dioxygenase-like lactoylglutathione lyase family enzyme
MRPKLGGLRHVALSVGDLERSLAFYRDVMGMALEWMPDPDNAYLTSGADNLALHRRSGSARPGAAQTLDHIGFVVSCPEDVDDWARYLEGRGVRLSMAPRTHRDGARSLYFEDPDGIRVQVIYHPPISEGGRK